VTNFKEYGRTQSSDILRPCPSCCKRMWGQSRTYHVIEQYYRN